MNYDLDDPRANPSATVCTGPLCTVTTHVAERVPSWWFAYVRQDGRQVHHTGLYSTQAQALHAGRTWALANGYRVAD